MAGLVADGHDNITNNIKWNQITSNCGWVSNYEVADRIIQQFCIENDLTFVAGKRHKAFNTNAGPDEQSKLHFCDKAGIIPFDGTPFVFVGVQTRECLFGRQKHKLKMGRDRARREAELLNDHPRPRKTRTSLQPSKKKGCKASVYVKEIVRFPNYMAKMNTERLRKNVSAQLRGCGITTQKIERRFYVQLPHADSHNNHPVTQLIGLVSPLHKDVRQEIHRLVSAGVTTVSECRRHLTNFISESYAGNMPKKTNCAYFPLNTTIRKHMYLVQKKIRYSQLDQENLLHLVAKWSEQYRNDRFVCFPAAHAPRVDDGEQDQEAQDGTNDEVFPTTPVSTSFFFCHQSEYQRHLLQRYGNEICLLDATYKTTKYALPLFFLAVKTNVGYSVAGEFVVESETREAIKQGLAQIKVWMEQEGIQWNPKHFMTDFCEREINAIEELFPNTFVYLCDFHREQSWSRWLTRKDNGLSNKKERVISMLRRCADSVTVDGFEQALNILQTSTEWLTNINLQRWISKTWLPERKRWVWAFRSDGHIVVNTNNGIERQNKEFKYHFLEQRKNLTVSAMVTALIEEYLPSMMLSYVKSNVAASDSLGGDYVDCIPTYLKNRPRSFVKHCMSKSELGGLIYPHEVEISTEGFLVKSQSDDGKVYRVRLEGDSLPECECHSWQLSHQPCKHMFAVINTQTNSSWHDLPESYRESPFFTLDDAVVQFVAQDSTYDGKTGTTHAKETLPDAMETVTVVPCDELPSRKTGTKSLAALCRERCDLIRSRTFICGDAVVLGTLAEKLTELNKFIDSHLEHDNDLVSDTSNNKRKPKSSTKPTLKKRKTTPTDTSATPVMKENVVESDLRRIVLEKVEITCGECGTVRSNREVYNSLSLSVKNCISLRQSLSKFFSLEEVTGYRCGSCHKTGTAKKQISISAIPRTFIVHLKRFEMLKGRRRKDGRHLKLDEFINLKMHVKHVLRNDLEYKGSLTGALVHYGSLTKGHYFCYVRSGLQWFKIDDTKVTKIKMTEQILGEAYILFYQMLPRPYID